MYGFFLSFRESIVEGYPELFASSEEKEGHQLSSEDGFGAKWGWYQSIYGLAKGDITKFDEVTSEPLYKCLMYLVFEKEKNQLEAKMIKNSMKR